MVDCFRSSSLRHFALAVTVLASAADACGQNATLQEQIFQHQQKLGAARTAKKRPQEMTELINIGFLYLQTGQMQRALEYSTDALPITRSLRNRGAEATTLDNMGVAYAGLGQKQKAVDTYIQALALEREIKNGSGEARVSHNLGGLYDTLGEHQKAIDSYNQALSIQRETHDRAGEGSTLFDIGCAHAAIGETKPALDSYEQALSVQREVHDRSGEARTLLNMGVAYRAFNDEPKAIEYYNLALPIEREIGNRIDEAKVLSNLGGIYSSRGERQSALDFLNQALLIERESHDRKDEAETLNNLGIVSSDMGEKQKALGFYSEALQIDREVSNRIGEANVLVNIGAIHTDLGQIQEALGFYNDALAIQREIDDQAGQARTLNNIGRTYSDLGDRGQGLDYIDQTLAIARQKGDRDAEISALINMGVAYSELRARGKALEVYNLALPLERERHRPLELIVTLNNIGAVYKDSAEIQKALEYFSVALSIAHEAGNPREEATILGNIGDLRASHGQAAIGLQDLLAALSLAKEGDDPSQVGTIDTSLMYYFHNQQRPQPAILFGTDAVNSFQQIRKDISGLARDLQASFAKSKSETYRTLAELLVQTNRLTEAEHVLDLLKDAEFKETVRAAAEDSAAKTDPVSLTEPERSAEAGIATEASAAASLTNASFEYDRLNALAAPTPDEKKKLKELSDKIAAGNAAIEAFFNTTLFAETGSNTMANVRVNETSAETSSLMNILAHLGPGVVALYTLVGEQHSYVIVTTANTRTRYEIKANAAELGKLVLAIREQLIAPDNDPTANLTALGHLLLDPIASDIAAAAKKSKDGVPTLLWSLDGVLRYLPMNALYDGKQYLVERARNVIITPESRNHLLDPASTTGLTAVAFGLSRSYKGANPLQGVLGELDAVVHDPTVKASHGPLSGKLLANDDFTLAAFEENLLQHYPVVHVASHFAFLSGNAGESFLLLGGDQTGGPGYELTLSQIQTDPRLSFRGTRLLTLSACGTAESGTAANGREIDSLGMVVQRRDAASVLATLWSVDDESTSLLMSDFYRHWATQSGIEKVEALRQSQMEMLRGRPFGHPYYWAPFVLIGNFH